MRVIIGIASSFLLIVCISLLVLPLTLTIFLLITIGSFIAFHLSQNPAGVSRALAHVRSLTKSSPKLRAPKPEGETTRRTATKPSLTLSPIYQPKLTDSVKERGKENIINYVRPTLKPRRFVNVERSEFQGKSAHQSPIPNWVPLKNSTASNFPTWSPQTQRPGEGVNLSTGITMDDKFSFSRLPLSPIYPPNKSIIDSPELDVSSTMLRFNSGQDSLLHPSMHYPTHQPDLVTSPGLVPSVSWLKDGGVSSPRHRRVLPRVQSPVMVKIASPLPDRPASPLFRKLASESSKQKASSTDKVIMAIKQRQKRTAQEASAETSSPLISSDVRNESKRRKLDSTSGKDVARSDIDMDLNPLPRRRVTDRVSRSSRYGITSPTPRNPIESSFSSSRKTQDTLKRRMDTSSIEVEEEDGVSPIKKKAPPQASQQSPSQQTPSKTTHPPATPLSTPGGSALRSGSRALHLEKTPRMPFGSPNKEAGTTPQKSNLKGKFFTPKRTPFVPRVDTPGEYTAADNKEDRAQARQRGSYLKEMLMQETEEDSSKDPTASAPKPSALFAGVTASSTAASTSAPLPTFSVGPLTTSTTSTKGPTPVAFSTATPSATSSSGGTSALGLLSKSTHKTSDNHLLSSSDKQKLTATSSEKTVQFGKPTAPQLNQSSSASAVSAGTTLKTGEASLGFKLPGAPSTGNGLLKVQDNQQPLTSGTNPMGTGFGGAAGVTQIDNKAQLLSANNNATSNSSIGGLGNTTKPETPSTPLSGGFTLGGSASLFGGSSKPTVPASSASTTPSSSQPQFPPIFGGASAAPVAQSSAGTTPAANPLSQAQAGGFQFGQKLGGSTPTTAGGLSFGNTKPASSVPSGLATPFPAVAQTSAKATTANNPMFSMAAPNTTAPTAAPSGKPQFPPIFGQQTPTKPAGATGLGQGAPSFGTPTSQAASGGFTFGQSAPSTNTAATPQGFNFGGNTAKPTSTASSSSTLFGSAQPAPSFGVNKPASAVRSSVFGSTPAPSQAPLGGATTNISTMFGGAASTQQKLAFGAPSNSNMFGSTPGTQNSTAPKPAFGNPTATVTPFGSGTSQPQPAAAAASSPFQFGTSQPKAPAQPAAPTGGFNFGGQATPQKGFAFGASAPAQTPTQVPSNGFQFGQTQGGAPPAQPQNFFGGAAANTASPFGAGGGFGTPAPNSGSTPTPSFGSSPSPAPAPAGGGFSIGTGGTNQGSNQRRANRLRQVRNRAGRR